MLYLQGGGREGGREGGKGGSLYDVHRTMQSAEAMVTYSKYDRPHQEVSVPLTH